MGAYMSDTPNENQEVSTIGRMSIPNNFKNSYILTSKQLNPTEDPALMLLGIYFDMYKQEMDKSLFKIYLDILANEYEKLVILNFNSINLELKQLKFLGIALAYCTQLETLELSQCGIGNKGLTYIVKGFSKVSGLIRLNLSKNQFTSSGLQYLLKGLKFTQVLEYLDLSYLRIAEEDIFIIKAILENCFFLSWIRMEYLDSDQNLIEMLENLFKDYTSKHIYISLKEDNEVVFK